MGTSNFPDDLPDDLATLWHLVRSVAHLMDREGEALFRRELGISLAQFLVLSVVDAHPGPLSQQAVADRLALTKGTVSRQVEAAVAAGLVTATVAPHTRRENALVLTGRGTALVRRGDDLFRDSRRGLLQALGETDIAAAISTLTALSRALGTASR